MKIMFIQRLYLWLLGLLSLYILKEAFISSSRVNFLFGTVPRFQKSTEAGSNMANWNISNLLVVLAKMDTIEVRHDDREHGFIIHILLNHAMPCQGIVFEYKRQGYSPRAEAVA
jgi:hypothetical protein